MQLWEALFEAGVSSNLIKILRSLYDNANIKVKTGSNEYTERIEITQGVLQEDCLSPLLFSLFVSDITHFFESEGHRSIESEVDLLLFVNDLIILARNPVDLQSKVDTLEKTAHLRNNRLTQGNPRFSFLAIEADPEKSDHSNTKTKCLNGRTAIHTLEYRSHHQVPLDSTLNMERAVTKRKISLGSVWNTVCANKTNNWFAYRKIFETCSRSTTLYGLEIWRTNHIQEINKILTEFYKRLLSLPRCTPGYAIRIETSQPSLESSVVGQIL